MANKPEGRQETAAERQARWRAALRERGIVEKMFAIAAHDVEKFKKLAEESRRSARPEGTTRGSC